MPRRRQPTTSRRRLAERSLRVRGIRRGSPDPRKLSRAFIALAMARAEAEARAQTTHRDDAGEGTEETAGGDYVDD